MGNERKDKKEPGTGQISLERAKERSRSLVQNMRDLGSRKPYLQKEKCFSHLFEHSLQSNEQRTL
jgi:hypothetical protein